MKKYICIMLAAVFVFVAAGCSKGDKVKKTTLYVEEDGSATSAIVESLDKDYYSVNELEKWINEAVDEFNKTNKGSIEVEKCEVEDGNAKVTLEFASLKDYGDFNNVRAFNGTIEEAQKAGYNLEGEFLSAKGKPSVTYAELEGSKSYYVLVIEEAQTVELENDILYASSNVKVKGKKAVIDKNTKEFAYIIYKP